MEHLIALIADFLGVEPEVIVALLPTLVFIFNLLARLIPDDSKGPLGVLNKIFKVLGLYVSNRVSKGISVETVAKIALDSDVPARTGEGRFSNLADVIRDSKGEVSIRFALLAGVAAVALASCATLPAVADGVCDRKEEILAAALIAMESDSVQVRATAEVMIAAVDLCDSGEVL